MKKIILLGLAAYSISSIAQNEKNIDKLDNTSKISEQLVIEEKKETPEYDLTYDKNLLTEGEQSCFKPFSSWHKSVNFYNSCDVLVNSKSLSVNLMSLQNKIRVIFNDNRPVFYDRIKMKLTINCSEVVKNYNFSNWIYNNRSSQLLERKKLENVNWVLTESSEKLSKQLCEQYLPDVYKKAETQYSQKLEKWKAVKEKNEKKKEDHKKTAKKKIDK